MHNYAIQEEDIFNMVLRMSIAPCVGIDKYYICYRYNRENGISIFIH